MNLYCSTGGGGGPIFSPFSNTEPFYAVTSARGPVDRERLLAVFDEKVRGQLGFSNSYFGAYKVLDELATNLNLYALNPHGDKRHQHVIALYLLSHGYMRVEVKNLMRYSDYQLIKSRWAAVTQCSHEEIQRLQKEINLNRQRVKEEGGHELRGQAGLGILQLEKKCERAEVECEMVPGVGVYGTQRVWVRSAKQGKTFD